MKYGFPIFNTDLFAMKHIGPHVTVRYWIQHSFYQNQLNRSNNIKKDMICSRK